MQENDIVGHHQSVTLLNLVIILVPFLKAGFLLATKSESETLSGK